MYPWKRFWCKWDGNYPSTAEGYLYFSESDSYRKLYPDVVSFESIKDCPCLILLGEPGIGKTSAIDAEVRAIESEMGFEDKNILKLDLNEISTSSDLDDKLFKSQKFNNWVNNEYLLYIFLDSLDECLLRIDNLAIKLKANFKNYPIGRLYLRIACRSADWQEVSNLEHMLKEIWGDNNVKIFELLPLTPDDVFIAAKAKGLDPDDFLREIGQRAIIAVT